MSNLLEEMKQDLAEEGKTLADVIWIGSRDGTYRIQPSEIETILNVDYESGYGAQYIAFDLVIVGNGWWLERSEYDGNEWWDFKTAPVLGMNPKPIKTVCDGGMWHSIEDMNE